LLYSSKTSRSVLGNFLVKGQRRSFSGVERPGREVDHSLPSGIDVKNDWGCTRMSIPRICMCGVDRENCASFTFMCKISLNLNSVIVGGPVKQNGIEVDVIHPEVFIRILRKERVSQTQLCGICNNTILHLKGYMFRL
jgi:hypothetical protein